DTRGSGGARTIAANTHPTCGQPLWLEPDKFYRLLPRSLLLQYPGITLQVLYRTIPPSRRLTRDCPLRAGLPVLRTLRQNPCKSFVSACRAKRYGPYCLCPQGFCPVVLREYKRETQPLTASYPSERAEGPQANTSLRV